MSRHISTDYGRHGRARVCCVGMLRSECVSIGSPGWLATAGRPVRTKPSRTGRPGDRCAMYDVRPPQSLDVSRFSCECVCVCVSAGVCAFRFCWFYRTPGACATPATHTIFVRLYKVRDGALWGGGGQAPPTLTTHTPTYRHRREADERNARAEEMVSDGGRRGESEL